MTGCESGRGLAQSSTLRDPAGVLRIGTGAEGEGFPDDRAVIADDAIDAHVEETVGGGGIVDGIDPDIQAYIVCVFNGFAAHLAVPNSRARRCA